MTLNKIVQPLLKWYSVHARILPWRETFDPYRIWVSEIMLQQTRVSTVIPYYQNFIKSLPTVAYLSEIDEPQLLKLWEGLGYYSRVRNMQRAAKIIMTKHGGEFPKNYEEILSLPGIGDYTAGAISSIAYQLPMPAVDGNVERVYARLTCTNNTDKTVIAEQLKEVYPMEHCGSFTQSLMELGALICLPKLPLCENCPLQDLCECFKTNSCHLYPTKKVKKARQKQELTVLMIEFEESLAIMGAKESGVLKGLRHFPYLEGKQSEAIVMEFAQGSNIIVKSIMPIATKKHIFTHIEWQMYGYKIVCMQMPTQFLMMNKQEIASKIALPTAFKQFLDV